jgi:transcriptional regulator with XRE-family HTH domain
MSAMSKRGTSIPVAEWWYEAVRRERGARGMRQVDLAKLVDDSEENVSRCVNGITPSLRLVLAISRVLRIPRPVFLPRTEAEALRLHGALALSDVDEEIEEVSKTVSEPDEPAANGGLPNGTLQKLRKGR